MSLVEIYQGQTIDLLGKIRSRGDVKVVQSFAFATLKEFNEGWVEAHNIRWVSVFLSYSLSKVKYSCVC